MTLLPRRNLLLAPGAVMMIRPHAFHPNPETRADNAFQGDAPNDLATTSQRAQQEHDAIRRAEIERSARIVALDGPAIELARGLGALHDRRRAPFPAPLPHH